MLRRGFGEAVAQQPGLELAGEAATGEMGLKLAKELAPDLVVMDLHLPDIDGLVATRRLLLVLPSAKIIIYSGEISRAQVDESLLAGARGYLSKASTLDELFRAIGVVMDGKLYVCPEVGAGILEDYRKSLTDAPGCEEPTLSEREKLLLRLVAAGRRNKEMAAQLGVSIKSVESYRSRLMKKLACASSAELVRYAIREGIAAP